MTACDLGILELPIDATDEMVLYVTAGLEWLQAHTKLVFDKNDIESVGALPAGAKLFLCKYAEIMIAPDNVSSESIGGMSQSFTQKSKDTLIWEAAQSLLNEKLLSQVRSVPHVSKWC